MAKQLYFPYFMYVLEFYRGYTDEIVNHPSNTNRKTIYPFNSYQSQTADLANMFYEQVFDGFFWQVFEDAPIQADGHNLGSYVADGNTLAPEAKQGILKALKKPVLSALLNPVPNPDKESVAVALGELVNESMMTMVNGDRHSIILAKSVTCKDCGQKLLLGFDIKEGVIRVAPAADPTTVLGACSSSPLH
jgi:hypothetical protein